MLPNIGDHRVSRQSHTKGVSLFQKGSSRWLRISPGDCLMLPGLCAGDDAGEREEQVLDHHRRSFVGAFQGRSWSHEVVLGAILWGHLSPKIDKVSK